MQSLVGGHTLDQGSAYSFLVGVDAATRDPLQHALPLVYSEPDLALSVLRHCVARANACLDDECRAASDAARIDDDGLRSQLARRERSGIMCRGELLGDRDDEHLAAPSARAREHITALAGRRSGRTRQVAARDEERVELGRREIGTLRVLPRAERHVHRQHFDLVLVAITRRKGARAIRDDGETTGHARTSSSLTRHRSAVPPSGPR